MFYWIIFFLVTTILNGMEKESVILDIQKAACWPDVQKYNQRQILALKKKMITDSTSRKDAVEINKAIGELSSFIPQILTGSDCSEKKYETKINKFWSQFDLNKKAFQIYLEQKNTLDEWLAQQIKDSQFNNFNSQFFAMFNAVKEEFETTNNNEFVSVLARTNDPSTYKDSIESIKKSIFQTKWQEYINALQQEDQMRKEEQEQKELKRKQEQIEKDTASKNQILENTHKDWNERINVLLNDNADKQVAQNRLTALLNEASAQNNINDLHNHLEQISFKQLESEIRQLARIDLEIIAQQEVQALDASFEQKQILQTTIANAINIFFNDPNQAFDSFAEAKKVLIDDPIAVTIPQIAPSPQNNQNQQPRSWFAQLLTRYVYPPLISVLVLTGIAGLLYYGHRKYSQ